MLATQAEAARAACGSPQFSPDVTALFTNTFGCEIDDTIFNDSDPAFLTTDWFGVSDWGSLDAKDDGPGTGVNEGPNNVGLTITGDGFGGDWSLSNLGNLQQALLVAKGGTDADPHALIVYRVLPFLTSGSWVSPFFGPSGQRQDTSHISVYLAPFDGSFVGDEVPLPAGIWLLLGGLGVFGVIARRRAA